MLKKNQFISSDQALQKSDEKRNHISSSLEASDLLSAHKRLEIKKLKTGKISKNNLKFSKTRISQQLTSEQTNIFK